MNTNRPSIRPRLTPAVIALAAGLAGTASAVDRSWTANSGDWSIASNWSPIGVPLSTDIARMGNLGGVDNNTVWLDQDDSVAGLSISDGMKFRTDGFNFYVNGDTLVAERNIVNTTSGAVPFPSTLRVIHVGLGADFFTHNLSVVTGAVVALGNAGHIQVSDTFTIGAGESQLTGDGTIELTGSGTTFVNEGNIIPEGGVLLLTQTANGVFDLDGTTGNGILNLGTSGGVQLTVQGQSLLDAFSSHIQMSAGSRLHMAIAAGWTADTNSTITAIGTAGGEPARITGNPFQFGGDANVTGPDAILRFESSTTFQNTAALSLDVDTRVETIAAAVINGGQFTLGEDARLDFQGATSVQGGTFSTHSNSFLDGYVSFSGATTWAGSTTINGIARQTGAASVSAAATINADNFDMDGSESTVWTITAPLTMNVGGLETSGSIFNGVLNIAGPIVGGRLTVNLDNPDSTWWMSGEMNLTGAALYSTRVAGSPMSVGGTVNVVSGNVIIAADTSFANSAEINIPAAANLRFMGDSTFANSASFSGAGTVQNATGYNMTLAGSTNTSTVGLANHGTLNIDESAGFATVNRFENGDNGTLNIQLGGYAVGTGFDRLYVSAGPAVLSGQLSVELIDLDGDGAAFHPVLGNSFLILNASVGGVSGAFQPYTVSHADGNTYWWTVTSNPTSVSIRLDHVNGQCPADFDADGFLTGIDYDLYVEAFEDGEPWADFDGDGFVTGIDFDLFVAAFESGC